MKNFRKENLVLASVIAGLICVAALFITATLAVGEMVFKGVKALLLHGEIDASKFSLLLVAAVFIYGAYFVHQNYVERKSFIYEYDELEHVGEDRREAASAESV